MANIQHKHYSAYEAKAQEFIEKQDSMMLEHEAGHMTLLKKFFPNNTYTYGINPEGRPCVNDNNQYDENDSKSRANNNKVDLAGVISVCKCLKFTRDETVKFVNELIEDGQPVGSDIWKVVTDIKNIRDQIMLSLQSEAPDKEEAELVIQSMNETFGYDTLIGDTYDLLTFDKIKEEVETQEGIYRAIILEGKIKVVNELKSRLQ